MAGVCGDKQRGYSPGACAHGAVWRLVVPLAQLRLRAVVVVIHAAAILGGWFDLVFQFLERFVWCVHMVFAYIVDNLDLFRPLCPEPLLGYPVVARFFLNGDVAAAEEPRGGGRGAGSRKGVKHNVPRL